jgi:hypothetical protein
VLLGTGVSRYACICRLTLYGFCIHLLVHFFISLFTYKKKQKYGIDYEEVFAPVARLDAVRLLIALAAHHNWKIYQLDVKSAFLNGILEEEVYIQQPECFIMEGK